MPVFSQDLQRRVRLRHAKKFDLQSVLGEEKPMIVYIGELPQAQQPTLLEFVQMRGELLARQKLLQPTTPGEELTDGDEGQRMMAALGEGFTRRLMAVQQDLICGALLDSEGDRMAAADARQLFDLLPINTETSALLASMLGAIIYGKAPSAPPAAPADAALAAAPAEPLGK